MKRKIVLMIILIAIASCKKISNSKIDAKIYVKQFKSEEPIPNVEVQIYRGKPGTGYGTELVETIYTNADGMARYKTNVDKDYDYFAFSKIENYYNEDNQVILTRGKRNFETTIFKYANSFVKLHIKNISPFNKYDFIRFNSACFSGHYVFQGSNIDTTFLWCDECSCAWFGNYNFNVGCSVTKNNITTRQFFSFTPQPLDTITVNVFF